MASGGILPWDDNKTPIQGVGQQGGVQPGNNNAALVANTDYTFVWSPAGQRVNHLLIQNNSTVPVLFELDNVTSLGSPIIQPAQTLFLDVQTITLHLQANGTPSVNGSAAANIVVRGWL